MAAPRPQTLDELREAIQAVVSYVWEDEMDDYRSNRQDIGDPTTHIFHPLVALFNWINGTDEDPDRLVDEEEEDN